MTRFRTAVLAAAVLATGSLLSACGSSGGGGSAATPAAGATAAGSAGALTITTASGPNGTYLTDGSGRALYLWVADKGDRSTCSGACASAWPPLTADGAPATAGSADASDVSTVARSDGSMQVTYAGHPLYYFAGDSGTATSGQGSNGFGAKWWLVSPSGTAITGTAAAAPSTSAPGGYY
jgi:predicted lipoprotein with Yx(FWY)xxD motif